MKNYLISDIEQDVQYMWDEFHMMKKFNEITRLINETNGNEKIQW